MTAIAATATRAISTRWTVVMTPTPPSGSRLVPGCEAVAVVDWLMRATLAAAIRQGQPPRAQRDQRAQIAVGSVSPRASSRTPSSPASTVPGRSAKSWRSISPIASADIRTA